MTNKDDDQFSKLLAESQGDFERDVMSLKVSEKPVETSPAPAARLISLEGNNKRVWSSHPKSGMR